jgi:hypothetical protein
MLPRIALTAFVAGTLLTTLMPVAGLAANRGGNSGGRGNSSHAQSFRGGSRGVATRGGEIRRSEDRSFVSPARGYSRGYNAPRSYGRPVYRGYYGSGVYLGIGAPYGYAYAPGYYDPGYAYDPSYSYGPAPATQACVPGSYDRNGNWIPNPNCSNPQQQYAPPQQNYNYNQQQYPEQYQQQPQQNYNYDQQQYPQQPSYDPNQRQGYSR